MIYRVIGRAEYRGHAPGETFEARLDPTVQARALRRGAIEIVDKTTPALVPGSYKLPKRRG